MGRQVAEQSPASLELRLGEPRPTTTLEYLKISKLITPIELPRGTPQVPRARCNRIFEWRECAKATRRETPRGQTSTLP